jgi:hypothetical protein
VIEFKDEQLKIEIFKILDLFIAFDIDGTIENIEFSEILEETNNNDISISIESEVEIYLYNSDCFSITVKELLMFGHQMEDGTLDEDKTRAYTKKEIDYLVRTSDYDTNILLDKLFSSDNAIVNKKNTGISLWENKINYDGQMYEICLFKGITIYNFLVQKSNDYDKYCPPILPNDVFILIKSNDIVNYNVAQELADALIFELCSSYDIRLLYSSRPDIEYSEYEYDDTICQNNFSIFPLINGKGIRGILQIYNKSITTDDYDFKILCLSRVIEYVSPTVSRENLNNSVLQKLSSPKIFKPDSEYILELEHIFKETEIYRRDNELIKLTLTQIVDISEILDILPKCICAKKTDNKTLDEKGKKELLEKISNCITDTRNEIAHAKANYNKKGNECPEEQKEELVNILNIIARQVIRWFSRQPEEKRMI